ncbi:MAG: hypothetical protein P1U63_08650 [Coxiellaceae bacterium]|nr:hypothetical protein [Coxiellaceae bacterium]
MRKLILTSLATVMVAGASTAALADSNSPCTFSGTVLGISGLTFQNLPGYAQNGVPSEVGEKSIPQICKSLISNQSIAKGNFAVTATNKVANGQNAYYYPLVSRYCAGGQALTPNDTAQLAQLSGDLVQVDTGCKSIAYRDAIYVSSGASKASKMPWNNNPAYPSSSSVSDTAPHQAQPNIQWNTPPKQKSSQSITTDQPDKGNVPTVNSPTPFNVTPKNNNNGGSNESLKDSNSSSRFF